MTIQELLDAVLTLGSDEHVDRAWERQAGAGLTVPEDLAGVTRAAFDVGYAQAIAHVMDLLRRAAEVEV